MDLPAAAFMGEPAVRQVAAQQYEVNFSYYLYIVAYNSFGASSIKNKVQFKLLVVMQGEIKLTLHPVKKSKTIARIQGGDFSVNAFHDLL